MKEYRYIAVAKNGEKIIGEWASLEGKTIQDLIDVEKIFNEYSISYQIEWR